MKETAWLLDELQHAGEEHFDPAHIEMYDRKSATDPSEDVELFKAHGINEASTLIDFGAGTGTFALAIAPYCARVIALDVSPQMLRNLHEKIKMTGINNVETVQAGFLSYQHQGELPDFIYSRNALHHLPDFWKVIALREMYSLLKPSGIMRLHDLVYSFEPDETEDVFARWLTDKPERPEDGYTREDLETHIRTEHSTFTWLFEPMLERVGFEILDADHRGGTYAAYTCRKRAR